MCNKNNAQKCKDASLQLIQRFLSNKPNAIIGIIWSYKK